MSDRGPNQDSMHLRGSQKPDEEDATYQDAGYLGTSEDDEEEVRDLGFIVEDHDDRRITLTDGWERMDDLDTDEPLETNRSGDIPHATARRERGVPADRFATDYHIRNLDGETQEEDFVETSMLDADPDMDAGAEDFTDETMAEADGEPISTDIAGHVPGVTYGLGTSLPQDLGRGGFQIRDNPLMQPQSGPISADRLSDQAMGIRDVDEMGSEEELDQLADRAAREAERRGSRP